MADQKISELTALTGANVADDDAIAIVDTSATETKKIVFSELKNALDTATGFVRITGDTMTGDLSMGDNVKAIFGAGSDLQIYHDGSESIIKDAGTGNLKILATDLRINNADSSKSYITGVDGSYVNLYYNGSQKLVTTSTGVEITGTLTSDGLTVSQENPKITITDTGTGADHELNGASSIGNLTLNFDKNDDGSSPYFYIQHAGSKLAAFRKGGDISFYEDTGTTAKFFWDADAEALGIGATSPTSFSGSRLVVKPSAGDAGTNDVQSWEYTSFSAGAEYDLRLQQVVSSGLVKHQFNVRNGGTDYTSNLVLDRGNVGIGTSSPSYPLHVSGTGDKVMAVTAGASSVAALNLGNSTNLADGGIRYDNSADALIFRASNAEKMRIDSSGNLQLTSVDQDIEFNATTTAHESRLKWNYGGTLQSWIEREHSDGSMVFGNQGSEAMRIDSSGRVGIGGVPNTNWRNDVADQEVLMLGAEATFFSDSGVTTELWNNAYVDNSDVFKNISTRGASRYFQYQGAHKWFTAASASAGSNIGTEINSTPKMILDVSGTLLIGQTTGTIYNQSSVTGITAGGSGSLQVTGSASTVLFLNRLSTGQMVGIYKDGGQVGSISITASSTAYNTSSDHRLKENVVDLTGATTRLKQLEPKRFNFIADVDTTVDGFLAHEVQAVVPEAITGTHNEVDADGNPVYQGIDQSKLVPLLVATIKELEARITALENT